MAFPRWVLLVSLTLLSGCSEGSAVPPDAGQGPEEERDGGVLPGDAGPIAPPVDAGPIELPADAGTIDALTLRFERATPEQLGVVLDVTQPLSPEATVALRYKPANSGTWRQAHPLLRIHPEWISSGAPEVPVDSFAGTVFDLTPGTEYHLELTLTVPGQPAQTRYVSGRTRALPAASGAATKTATPASNLQALFDGLLPGEVLELDVGTYPVSGLNLKRSGTQSAPIVVRGRSRSGVVLKDSTGSVLQVQDASHFVIENLTLEGSNTDSGTAAGSVGVSFWNGAQQQNATLRGLDVRGVDQGIVASGRTSDVLVYDCDLKGNNVWTQPFIETNLTWNDDGIRLPGQGNCAFENTLHGFGDAFAVIDGVFSAAVYFYRNRVSMTGDDAFEADYATRNVGFYDNHLTNSATFLSLDPLWGGPLYAFRNISINTQRGPLKLNDTNSGFLVYNNTIVRTEGRSGWGWVQFNNGALRGWSFRNNVLVYLGTGGQLLAIESSGNDPIDFTHNAWFPDGKVWWSTTGGSYASLAAARTGVPATTPLFGTATRRHDGDLVLAQNPFSSTVTLGASHLNEVTSQFSPTLPPGSPLHGAGTPIPNVTDDFAGAAPDLGAVISGRATPRWGAQRP